MNNIYETAVNLCFLTFTELSAESIDRTLKSYKEQIISSKLPSPDRVYLGAEFCDRIMMFMDKTKIKESIKFLNSKNYKVSYVIPAIRQSNLYKNLEVLDYLLGSSSITIDELVVNDFGILAYLQKEKGKWACKLTAGRLFDKGVREGRFNIFKNSDYQRNSEEASKFNLTESAYTELFQTLGVTRLETDTLPDGFISIEPNCPLNISIYYPRIFLSQGSYCEYSGIGRKDPNKFRLENLCNRQCSNQFQLIKIEEGRILYKIGNAVFTRQTQPIEQIVNFQCRLVYTLL